MPLHTSDISYVLPFFFLGLLSTPRKFKAEDKFISPPLFKSRPSCSVMPRCTIAIPTIQPMTNGPLGALGRSNQRPPSVVGQDQRERAIKSEWIRNSSIMNVIKQRFLKHRFCICTSKDIVIVCVTVLNNILISKVSINLY